MNYKGYYRTLGLCYAITEDNAPQIFGDILDFLGSDAPDDLRLKVYHALFQITIDYKVRHDILFDILFLLCHFPNNRPFITLLNQKRFIKMLIKKCFGSAFTSVVFLLISERILSNDTVRYILNQPNLPEWKFACFVSHPAILENIEWQKKCIKYFYIVSKHVNTVYVTDQAIEESDPEDVKDFVYKLSIRNEPINFACSLECLKRTLYTYLISQNSKCIRSCIEWLNKGQSTFNYVPKPPEFNVKPYRYRKFNLGDFCNVDTLNAAIEKLCKENLDRILKLLELFIATYPNKKKSTSIYVKFRGTLINLIKTDPVDVAKILHFNCKNKVVHRLFYDRIFMKVVSSLRKKGKVHIDFNRYIDKITSRCNYTRQSLFTSLC